MKKLQKFIIALSLLLIIFLTSRIITVVRSCDIFEYDENRNIVYSLENGQEDFYSYDENNNCVSIKSVNGSNIDFTFYNYNDKNQLVEIRYTNGNRKINYEYNSDGKKIKEVSEDGIKLYEYSEKGLLDKVILPDGIEVSYVYDDDKIIMEKYSNGNKSVYEYINGRKSKRINDDSIVEYQYFDDEPDKIEKIVIDTKKMHQIYVYNKFDKIIYSQMNDYGTKYYLTSAKKYFPSGELKKIKIYTWAIITKKIRNSPGLMVDVM